MKKFKIFNLIIVCLLFASNLIGAEVALVYKDLNNIWHFIDDDGKEFLKRDDIILWGGFREGLFRAKIKLDNSAKWVYFDSTGENKIILDYDDCMDFFENRAIVIINQPESKFNRKYGFIDKSGKIIVPIEYYDAVSFQEGLAYVMNENERKYIDTNGNTKIKLADSLVGYNFSEGLASVSTPNYKVGYINKNGELVIDYIFDEPGEFKNGFTKATYNGMLGLINWKNQPIIPFKYYDIQSVKENRTFVSIPSAGMAHIWALADTEGNILSEHKYLYAKEFNQGLAAVKDKEKKWYYITLDGKDYLDLGFRYLDNFAGKNELAWASFDENGIISGSLINKVGEKVFSIQNYTEVYDLRWNRRVY